eukprot:TRINITY_DN4886_c0_g1_i3.p1 TRINITY_DN4886_c0_g1~~TRINITY_DN4886_c0_g1_i3.p1  ORF type:complete len:216 (+),score=-22.95 TRINITY_DN4886_c0_g1_i3:459-1106(+)
MLSKLIYTIASKYFIELIIINTKHPPNKEIIGNTNKRISQTYQENYIHKYNNTPFWDNCFKNLKQLIRNQIALLYSKIIIVRRNRIIAILTHNTLFPRIKTFKAHYYITHNYITIASQLVFVTITLKDVIMELQSSYRHNYSVIAIFLCDLTKGRNYITIVIVQTQLNQIHAPFLINCVVRESRDETPSKKVDIGRGISSRPLFLSYGISILSII